MTSSADLALRGQRLGMRLLTRVGGLPVLGSPEIRARVERALTKATHESFRAASAATRVFTPAPGRGRPTRSAATPRRGLFDLTPTEDQLMLRDAARAFATEILRPAAATADTARKVPEEVADAATEMGLGLLGVPTELGGIAEERSAVTSALVLEELACGDAGLTVAVMAAGAVATAIARYGSAAQQATYLPHFTQGTPAAAALAIHEPQPLFDPLSPRTIGVIEGDRVTLGGVKSLVPYAASADLFVVSALVSGEPRLVIVPASTPGLTVQDDPAMGLRAAATGRLVLADVDVDVHNLLGTAADHADAVRRSRVAWAAVACGISRAVLEQVTPYVTERQAFGAPIAHRQAVAFAVADMALELDGLRLVTWRAAARLDADRDASGPAAHARALVASHGARIGSEGVQLLGGHGFVKEWGNERWFRDLRGAGVLEGTLLV